MAKNRIKEMILSSMEIYLNSYAAYNCFTHSIGHGLIGITEE